MIGVSMPLHLTAFSGRYKSVCAYEDILKQRERKKF